MAGGKRKGAGAPKGNKNNPGLNDHPNTKAKQFGAENGNPQIQDSNCGYPTWSVRGAQRYFAAQPIDLDDTNALTNMLGRRKVSVAEAIALKQIRKALAGEDRAMESVTDNIEGKIPTGFIHGNDPNNPMPGNTLFAATAELIQQIMRDEDSKI